MARLYATSAEYLTYTGAATAPAAIDTLLAKASRILDSSVFRLCWFDADATTGMPTNAVVLAAFRDATCAQVAWWDELGDSTGAVGSGWGSVQVGTVQLSRSVTSVSQDASPARQIAAEVWDVLQAPDLTADIFVLGMVTS